MRKTTFELLRFIFVFLFALGFTQPVLAHSSEPRLEISVERVNPGGVVDVRGVEFDYDQSVTLYLERPGILIQLGEVVADVEGIFLHIIVLPVDIPDGVYNIRALTDHHEVLSPALTVQGPAILGEGGGQGERDEDDGLLAPMPTFAPGVVPGGVSQSSTHSVSPIAPVPGRNSTMFVALILLALGILVVFGLRIMTKR